MVSARLTRVFQWPTFGKLLAVLVVSAGVTGASAQSESRIEIFDAHLHYNQEPNPFYPLDKVLEIFRRNGVTGILATSRPNRSYSYSIRLPSARTWALQRRRPPSPVNS